MTAWRESDLKLELTRGWTILCFGRLLLIFRSVLDAELPLAGSSGSFSSQLCQLSREVSRGNTGERVDDSLNPRQPARQLASASKVHELSRRAEGPSVKDESWRIKGALKCGFEVFLHSFLIRGHL